MKFNEFENNFNLYMLERGMNNRKTKGNYRSWLKYLEKNDYDLFNLSISSIELIVNNLRDTVSDRDAYKREDDLSNFRSALRKFLEYFKRENDNSSDNQAYSTQTEQLILSRRGHDKFKRQVLDIFEGKCVVTGCKNKNLLIASHIKPWKLSTDFERIDPNNGFPLIPNYDKLFDKGFVTFDKKFPHKLLISSNLDKETGEIFGLNESIAINLELNNEQIAYLIYHNENIFVE